MRLHKDFINELKGRVANRMLSFLTESSAHGMLLTKLSTLFPHIDSLEQELTELSQSNLMHKENEQHLMVTRSGLNDDVIALTRTNNALINENSVLDKINSRLCLTITNQGGEINSLKHRLAQREQDVITLTATLEKAMLDHQPVVLPEDVVEAVIHYQKELFTADSFARLFFKHIECGDNEYTKTLKNYVIGSIENGNKLLRALVNGYTVEKSNEEGVAQIVNDWMESPGTGNDAKDVDGLIIQLQAYRKGIKK